MEGKALVRKSDGTFETYIPYTDNNMREMARIQSQTNATLKKCTVLDFVTGTSCFCLFMASIYLIYCGASGCFGSLENKITAEACEHTCPSSQKITAIVFEVLAVIAAPISCVLCCRARKN